MLTWKLAKQTVAICFQTNGHPWNSPIKNMQNAEKWTKPIFEFNVRDELTFFTGKKKNAGGKTPWFFETCSFCSGVKGGNKGLDWSKSRDPYLWFFRYLAWTDSPMTSGQIIVTSHDLTPNGGLVREIPLFRGNLGWWNIIVWPDDIMMTDWYGHSYPFFFWWIGMEKMSR